MGDDFRLYLDRLISGAGGLTASEAESACASIASGVADPSQTAALLALLAARGEGAPELTGFARAMRAACTPVALPHPVMEIVGTGGDGFGTMNISTAAAVLTAACGVPVAKHGSVSVSSRSGAADVLEALGVAHLPPAAIPACVARVGVAFMFAPLFHPAMRAVLPTRRALRVRTIFNLLGPLLNPAGATRLLLGVFRPALLPLFAAAAADLGAERALIVHCCGMDELAPVGPAQCVEVRAGGETRELVVDPAAWGVPRCTVEDLRGGTPAENAATMARLLAGGDAEADSHLGRTVALNAGAALYVFGAAESIEAGYGVALRTLREGAAGRLLERWAAASQELAAQAAAAAP